MSQLIQIRAQGSNEYTKLRLVLSATRKDIIGPVAWEIKFLRKLQEYNHPIYSILQESARVDIKILEIFEYYNLWNITIFTIDNSEVKEFTNDVALIVAEKTKWKTRGVKLLKKKYTI